ncbi:MAG: glucosamine-6-phosphate deaminase, partial [Candidatus Omnitrophica bacterium]|nr:glucosamine-6-phosphate deaminase [Candidatus Omnitrophota bacterium]
NSFAIMRSAFNICFGSQKSASFPSYEYDGPFCDLAQKIMAEQYAMMKTCLGREFFYSSEIPRLRATRGLVFLREMEPEEFFAEARYLKQLTESAK